MLRRLQPVLAAALRLPSASIPPSAAPVLVWFSSSPSSAADDDDGDGDVAVPRRGGRAIHLAAAAHRRRLRLESFHIFGFHTIRIPNRLGFATSFLGNLLECTMR